MPVSDTLIGTVFDGRYRVVRKLGTGGMANVYLAEDQELGRNVAIKILDDRHAGDDQFVERFRREAKNAASLSHPNIVSIYDRGEAEGTYYIAMEFLDGRTLKELITEKGPVPTRLAIDYARQILAAVGFAHKHGIVHRDVKPHNVLVSREGRLKVTDFGIARSGASQMTEVGSIIGTAQYLSPEQARGSQVTPASDIYSVGIVLYEMLTGEVPFTGDTPLEIAMKHLSAIPEPPSRKRPDVPRDLDMIVLRALAKNPRNRYQSAEEMDADLGRVARGLAVSDETATAATMVLSGAGIAEAAPTTISRPTAPMPPRPPVRQAPPAGYYGYEEPPRRRPWWPWVLALLLLVAAGIGAWFAYNQIQDQLNANKPVAVPNVVGIDQSLAVAKVKNAGFTAHVVNEPSETVKKGVVSNQDPPAGSRQPKGNAVTITVSSGVPQTTVPDVKGKSQQDAFAALADANLKWSVAQVYSTLDPGTVTAQDPKAGTKVPEKTVVHVNVSQGVKPVQVPGVVGEPYEQAAGELQGQNFAVKRIDVDSDQPKGTVVGQDPGANAVVTPGSTVTLSVSKGPTTTAVPDVTSSDEATATATLQNSGFNVKVKKQPTTDPSQDGIVLDQDPVGGTNAQPGSTVTIFVGHASGPPATTTTP
jgi:eukaryotic-like serine/threonine-protein kinase